MRGTMKASAEDEESLCRPYVCPECAYDTWDATEMGKHIERHRPMTAPKFVKRRCPKCRGCGCQECYWTGKKKRSEEHTSELQSR